MAIISISEELLNQLLQQALLFKNPLKIIDFKPESAIYELKTEIAGFADGEQVVAEYQREPGGKLLLKGFYRRV